MKTKLLRSMLAMCVALMFVCTAWAATYPKSSGDIADNTASGWNGAMPGSGETAAFNKANGVYTASNDVTFSAFSIANSSTFNIDSARTISLSCLYVALAGATGTINGGLWDFTVASSSSSAMPARTLAPCNQNVQNNTTLALAGGCIATNLALVRTAYNSSGNTLRIIDSSRVYADAVALSNNKGAKASNGLLEVSSGGVLTVLGGNFRDTAGVNASDLVLADATNSVWVSGTGSKIVLATKGTSQPGNFNIGAAYGRNSLLVEEGGEIVAPSRFLVGVTANANSNTAVFATGAKGGMNDVRVGEGGSVGNVLAFRSHATGTVDNVIYVGGIDAASSGNRLVVSNATLSCSRAAVSFKAGSTSNAIYIVGSDTCFTTTVTSVPRYPFVDRGAYNTFEMDGAEWNYWLNMQLDTAAASNTFRFVNGARMNMVGGLYSGTNHIASCGNRVYVGSGAQMNLAFLHMSRYDNVVIVSNATVTAFGSGTENARGIRFGLLVTNVDASTIGGNGLILQGDSPKVVSEKDFRFYRNSFLRFELPSGGCAANHVPIEADSAILDPTTSLEVKWPDGGVNPGCHTLISTASGITIDDSVLSSASADLRTQSGGRAKLALANGNKDLVLKIARGLVVSFR